LRRGQNDEVPTVVPTPPDSPATADLPAELASIITRWASLPAAVQAGILAMINAAQPSDK